MTLSWAAGSLYNSGVRTVHAALILALLGSNLSVAAAETSNAAQVLGEAKAQAAAQHKEIFLIFGASW